MAYSFTAVHSTVFGNERVLHGVVAVDAASGVVSFGLGFLYNVLWSPKSMATDCVRVRVNGLAAGTASVGDFGVSGAASGDEIYVTVFGR